MKKLLATAFLVGGFLTTYGQQEQSLFATALFPSTLPMFEQYLQQSPPSLILAPNKVVGVAENECEILCFDEYTEWYWNEFWLLQELGFHMIEAHELAMASSNTVYVGCKKSCD